MQRSFDFSASFNASNLLRINTENNIYDVVITNYDNKNKDTPNQ